MDTSGSHPSEMTSVAMGRDVSTVDGSSGIALELPNESVQDIVSDEAAPKLHLTHSTNGINEEMSFSLV